MEFLRTLKLRDAVARCLEKGVNLKHNIEGELIDVWDTGTANTAFYVSHALDYAPDLFTTKFIDKTLANVYVAGTAWAGESAGTFFCSADNAHVKLWLEFED